MSNAKLPTRATFAGEGKLRVALVKRLLCVLALCDVAGDTEQADGHAIDVAQQ